MVFFIEIVYFPKKLTSMLLFYFYSLHPLQGQNKI